MADIERLLRDAQRMLPSSIFPSAAQTRGFAGPLSNSKNKKSGKVKSKTPHVGAASVSASGDASVRLLQLLAVVVRLTPEQLESCQMAGTLVSFPTYQAVGLFLGNLRKPKVPRSPVWLQREVFVHKLSRMHTLQALSRQLAAAGAAVKEAAALPGGTQGRLAYENASAVAADSLRFLEGLAMFSYNALNIADDARSETSVSSALRGCCVELVAALYDSCVMEHAAKLLLLLSTRAAPPADTSPQLQDQQEPEPLPAGQQPPPQQQQQQQQQSWSNVCDRNVKEAISYFTCMDRNLSCCFGSIGDISATASDQLQEVLSGRCVLHAVLTHALAALCEADKGETYGFPPDVLRRVPVSTSGKVSSRVTGALRVLSDDSKWLDALSALLPAFRAPPLSRRAALRLLQRIGNLAVASGQVWAEAAGAAAAGAAGGSASGGGSSSDASLAAALGLRAVLSRGYDASVALQALLVMRLNLQPLQPDDDYTRWVNEVAIWWRLLAGYARHMAARAPAEEVEQLAESAADVLDEYAVLETEGFTLPAAPPPGFAAALAGGLLPCLERLLRRAGGNFGGPEASLAQGILRSESCLPLLLLYGEHREAAALVATIGKLLRVIDPRVIWEALSRRPEVRTEATTFCLQLIEAACDFLFSAADTMEMLQNAASANNTSPDGDIGMDGNADSDAVSNGGGGTVSYDDGDGDAGVGTEGSADGAVEFDSDDDPSGEAADKENAYDPEWQLRLLTSCALCEWLPPLSRLAQQIPVAVRPQAGGRRRAAASSSSSSGGGGGGGGSHGNWLGFHAKVLGAVTRWLPAMMAKCVKEREDAAAAAAAAARGSVSSGGATSAGPTASAVSEDGSSPESDGDGGHVPVIGSGGWRPLLLEDIGVVPLLGTALKLFGTADPDPHLQLLCYAVVSAFSDEVRAWAAAAAGSAAAAAGGVGRASCSVSTYSAVAGWRRETMRRVLEVYQEADGDSMREMLAARAQAVLLVWPCALWGRRLLRRCGNPGCVNLAGDSETELGLKACRRCGEVEYCCRECQTAHWRAWHKEVCGRKCED